MPLRKSVTMKRNAVGTLADVGGRRLSGVGTSAEVGVTVERRERVATLLTQ